MSQPTLSKQMEPRIVRAPLKELTIYDVSEAELEAIERGGPESLLLNFGILFLTTAISFTVTLATTDIKSVYLYIGFFVVTVVSYAAALVIGSLWLRSLKTRESVIACIRGRRPPVGEALTSLAVDGISQDTPI